jgi:hypothetical protein
VANFSAYAVVVKAKVYDIDGDQSKQLYQFERREKIENGKKIAEVTYKDMQGSLAVSETVIYNDPNNKEYVVFDEYVFDRPQSQEKAIIKNENGKLKFHHEKNGKIKDRTEDLEPNTIVRDQYVVFLRKNWEALMKDEKIKSRLVVPDRSETIGFTIKKDSEFQMNGKSVIRFKFTPNSFIIAMIAKDAFFTLEKDGEHRLVRVEGRMPVFKKVDNEFKNMFGRLNFEYIEE